MNYVTPKEASSILGLTRAAISKCVAKGAPIHRWGPTGRCYKIDIDEFITWMDQHGREARSSKNTAGTKMDPPVTADQMAERRRELLKALGG